ncbi:hypothetical protein POSPLADRAFT_1058341 [Postia placenta MAD-698-R-SB12]|uniref:HIG1 domain-containing protein n=1 Tax=Postia placenta MAD-698-R-SB12 TaxID=670580 RepID=A0A1X6MUW4_9APHY|nr:hypothetical protein POSPLADRAFT_1058341 [Postia placenta MAD-698-R-SB12]OSX60165.1 hypothetical protein POSPLADRAFT_1058341 [Postia placenta MAD-698-R-SB12]
MKLATKEELEAHQAATVRGALEGTVAGLAISVPASFWLHRSWPAYRALPVHLKVMGAIFVVAPLYAIQAERRGVEFDKSTWTGAGKAELEREHEQEVSRWNRLDSKEKITDWANRNQYKIILGSWAASMAVAGALVMRNKHQTASQKIVQARMWAQGLTVGVLIAAGVLTHANRAEAATHRQVDHTWQNMVEEFQQEERIAKAKLAVLPAPQHS